MVRQWIEDVRRRQRIARYRRREVVRTLQDERNADHVERVRQGIKDTPPPSLGPMGG